MDASEPNRCLRNLSRNTSPRFRFVLCVDLQRFTARQRLSGSVNKVYIEGFKKIRQLPMWGSRGDVSCLSCLVTVKRSSEIASNHAKEWLGGMARLLLNR